MFEGFDQRDIATTATSIRVRIGGAGPPLLLLHGYPQTHAMWHRVAPALAERCTVVCADLRGYGDSGRPASDPEHAAYSKRATAQDMVEVMTDLGFARFSLAGHDRGGRVAHRLALDHPERLESLAVLDIVPTRTVFRATDQALATAYYHWFFLSQPYDLPERLIGADPVYYLRRKLGAWAALDHFAGGARRVRALLQRPGRDPRQLRGLSRRCDDRPRPRRGRSRPLDPVPRARALGRRGVMERHFDVLATWREKAAGPVSGRALDCGHFLAEELPEETAGELLAFFA